VLGRTGGPDLAIAGLATISVAKLRQEHENWFPAFMAGGL
jgi:phosphoribosylformylglycinamidine synthase